MASTTGTFEGATDLLNKINTFLVANSWTKLFGETDIVPASPKSARYWRLLVLDTDSAGADFREINLLEWRTTVGGANVATNGANYSFSNVASGGGSDLVSGIVKVRSSNIQDNWWSVTYDFGSATVVREVEIKCGTLTEAPAHFFIQWSHDNKVWMTMDYVETDWTTENETQQFAFDTAYFDTFHPSSTIGRRGGSLAEQDNGATRNIDSEGCNNWWSWQGPGYDADRRVYVHALTYSQESVGVDAIKWDASIDSDIAADILNFGAGQDGSILSAGVGDENPTLLVSSSGGEYWLYLSSTRLFVVTKSGIDDYSSAYIGFLGAFAVPDDWAFPLYVGATYNDRTALLTDTGAAIRDAVDPGIDCAYVRLWDNNWQSIGNHNNDAGRINDPIQFPEYFTWPFHTGWASQEQWPDSTIGDYIDWDAHWLDRLEPTAQGDLPLFPVIIMSREHGNIGALDGIYCAPQGGVYSPEQVLTIATVDYRIFSVRDKSGGMVYWAVLED